MFLFDELKGLDWSPQADVYRTPTGWVVVLDLAGVSPDEVTVEATRSELRVAGVRRDRFVKRGFLQHSMEISYSRFERSLRLIPRAAALADLTFVIDNSGVGAQRTHTHVMTLRGGRVTHLKADPPAWLEEAYHEALTVFRAERRS